MRFLNDRNKVKVTIMFRGREVAHPERGETLLNRLAEDLGEMAVVEQRPIQDGRNMTMMLAPGKSGGRRRSSHRRALPRRPGPRPAPGRAPYYARSPAQDEDALGRQEALPQDRHRQAARPARLHEPHPEKKSPKRKRRLRRPA